MIKALQNKLFVFTTQTWTDLLVHFALATTIISIIGVLFVYSFLPSITHHGQVITVPDLQGMPVDEAQRFLSARGMDFMVLDTSYSRKHKLNVVLSQTPAAGEKVKRGRRIMLTINPKNPPKKKVPDLDGQQLVDVKRMLENVELEIGNIKYKPDLGKDVVLEYYVAGRKMDSTTIAKGYFVPVGTKIDLLVADGRGETEFNVPDLIGLSEEEAEEVAKAHEVTLSKHYDYKSKREVGTVIWQNPPTHIGTVRRGVRSGSYTDERERNKIRAGDIIDIRVSGNPAAKPMTDKEREEYERQQDSLQHNINHRLGKDMDKHYDRWKEEDKNNPKETPKNTPNKKPSNQTPKK